jgi:hypothetical protein
MKILSHRGHWKRREERNTLAAFERSFDCNFGTEVDVRDCCGSIVISHDLPDTGAVEFEKFLELYNRYENLSLAINIKSDGLQALLDDLLKKYQVDNYFVFDMSVPDGLEYIRMKMKVFTRQSEYETGPAFYEQACGVWMDSFDREWMSEEDISCHLNKGKKVCLVSGELHNREYFSFWQKLSEMKVVEDRNLMICTDYPQQARRLFDGKD